MKYEFGYEVMRPRPVAFVRWLRLVLAVSLLTAALCGAELIAIAELLK